jgi:hypothetical protein
LFLLKEKDMKMVLQAFAFFILCCSFTPPAVQLDGVINADEWKGAKEADLRGGGKVFFRRDGNVLYVALKGVSKGWAHVYLSHNDTVHVMHASAALGSVTYFPQEAKWSTIQKFNWQLRDRSYSDTTARKMEDYFRQNGWVANNVNIGDGMTAEFKIDLSRFATQKLAFACLFASKPETPSYYPEDLSDHTILKDLVYGNAPAQLEFNPKTWHKL